MQFSPGVPFEIYSEGKQISPVVSGDVGNQTWSFPAAGSLHGDQFILPQFTMRLHYACGWREVSLPLTSSWAPEWVRKTADNHETLAMNASPPYQSDPRMSIDVDNRGGDVHAFELGELSYPIGSGKLVRVDAYQPDCANVVLKIDGNEIGSVPAATKSPDPNAYREGPYIFIDPTAARCYRLRPIRYSRFSEYLSSDSGQGSPETFRGKRFYLLQQRPEYVLTPPASVITTQNAYETQYQLSETSCR